MLLGVGAKKKTYLDDVFSTYLYSGSSTSGSGPGQTITNGLDLAGEGGLVWLKSRNANNEHALTDTVNGAGKRIQAQSDGALGTTTASVSGFTSSGFSLPSGWNPSVNAGNQVYASWAFRKAPGFFDVVSWTGNGTAGRTISHSLGSIPGCIMVKCTSTTNNWVVYHRHTTATHYTQLHSSAAAADDNSIWNDVEPTSTNFTIGDSGTVNDNNETYVAYVFAGGESTAATARSVEFDGNDSLKTGNSNDFILDGDFTIEAWVNAFEYASSDKNGIFAIGNYQSSGGISIYVEDNGIGIDWSNQTLLYPSATDGYIPGEGSWWHIAVVRSSNTVTLYVNGQARGSFTETDDWGNTNQRFFGIGARWDQGNASQYWDGKISNVRVVKGTAVYTSSFKPPTEPLTNITNTKLLCCNNASATGTTTGSVTSGGDPQPKGDSPFDDPAGFVFGDNEDQNLIKTDGYIGSGVIETGPKIYLGWEPQWILIKGHGGEDWLMFDCMRGCPDDDDAAIGGRDRYLRTNSLDGENDGTNWIRITSDGFEIYQDNNAISENGSKYTYIAIRRADGWCGKPVDTATNVFAMDTGNSSNDIPCYDSGFPVDLALFRTYNSTADWFATARLMGRENIKTNEAGHETPHNGNKWDSSVGWRTGHGTNEQSWMWKRHAGLDVVMWMGDEIEGRGIPHSLGKAPEMIWVKQLDHDNTNHWAVGHKGLNGGTNPWQYFIELDDVTYDEQQSSCWNNTAPNSTHFVVNNANIVNQNNRQFLGILFASVDGISKVGSWVGSNSEQTITLGFEPRFLLLKNIDTTNWWEIRDTGRGWATSSGGTSQALYPNENAAQSSDTVIHKTSTGFVMAGNIGGINQSGSNYIYYAHA